MPRKKKAVQSQLPPLLFVNSPDFQSVPILTPDLAVDNPVTARPVPVENLIDRTWVSPQFCNRHDLSKCQNSRRNHMLTRARDRIGENGHNDCTRKLKFKPLIFLDDNNSDSVVPTVSFTDATSVDMNNIVVHTPNFTQQHKSGAENVNMDSCNAVIVSDIQNCNNSRSIEVTPTRIIHRDRTEIHQLLKPNNLFSLGSLVHSDKLKQYDDPVNHLGRVQISRELNHPEMHGDNIRNTPSNVFSCHPQKNQLTCLLSRTPQEGNNKTSVLAVDTPECDYSLTFRQRQLKYR